MPSNELEARRSGLQTYLTALSKLTETWRCDTVTSVLCPSENGPTTAASPAFEVIVRYIVQHRPHFSGTMEGMTCHHMF